MIKMDIFQYFGDSFLKLLKVPRAFPLNFLRTYLTFLRNIFGDLHNEMGVKEVKKTAKNIKT